MQVTVDEYTIAVPEETVTDPGEYQDAWGFVTVAREMANGLDVEKSEEVRATLDEMLRLWPDNAPTTPDSPASSGQISALAARVLLDLPQS